MAELCFAFDSIGTPPGDRAYTSADIAQWMYEAGMRAEGVCRVDNLLGVSAGGLVSTVSSGVAFKGGRMYKNTAALNLALGAIATTYKRIDVVVIRFDALTLRFASALVIAGTPSTGTPVAPAINASTDIQLANILIDNTSGSPAYTITTGAAVPLSAYPALLKLYIGDANNSNTAFTFGYRCNNSDGSVRSTTGPYIVIPNASEASLVGVGTRGAGVAAHDVFALAEFKDDQKETHSHSISAGQGYHNHGQDAHNHYWNWGTGGGSPAYSFAASGGTVGIATAGSRDISPTVATNQAATLPAMSADGAPSGRTGTVTRGKRLGVNFIIKY